MVVVDTRSAQHNGGRLGCRRRQPCWRRPSAPVAVPSSAAPCSVSLLCFRRSRIASVSEFYGLWALESRHSRPPLPASPHRAQPPASAGPPVALTARHRSLQVRRRLLPPAQRQSPPTPRAPAPVAPPRPALHYRCAPPAVPPPPIAPPCPHCQPSLWRGGAAQGSSAAVEIMAARRTCQLAGAQRSCRRSLLPSEGRQGRVSAQARRAGACGGAAAAGPPLSPRSMWCVPPPLHAHPASPPPAGPSSRRAHQPRARPPPAVAPDAAAADAGAPAWTPLAPTTCGARRRSSPAACTSTACSSP